MFGDIMFYYINSLYLYSLFGFIMESTVYKIKNCNRHSSIFYGPITMVYGFGILLLLIVKKYFLDKLRLNGFKRIFVIFFTCVFVLSFTEWLGGNILYILFKVNLWDYSKKYTHIGKYLCIDLCLVWGFLGTFYILYLKDFTDKIIKIIPKRLTILFIILNILDTIFVFLNKFVYW